MNMIPWLILTFVFLLVSAGLIIERIISGYLNRKEIRELRVSQERGFAHLALIQKELFAALKLSYRAAAKAYEFAMDEMKLTNEKLGIRGKDKQKELEFEWPNILGERDGKAEYEDDL